MSDRDQAVETQNAGTIFSTSYNEIQERLIIWKARRDANANHGSNCPDLTWSDELAAAAQVCK
jgi:hypothetical protein